MIHLKKLIDPNSFQTALGEVRATLADEPFEALVDLWNGEIKRVIDIIVLRFPSQGMEPGLFPGLLGNWW